MNDETQQIIAAAQQVGRLEVINKLYEYCDRLGRQGDTQTALKLAYALETIEKQQ